MYLVLVATLLGGGEEVHPITTYPLLNCHKVAQDENAKRDWHKVGYKELRSVAPNIIKFKFECRKTI